MKYVKHVKKDSHIKLTDKIDVGRKCELHEKLDTEDLKPQEVTKKEPEVEEDV